MFGPQSRSGSNFLTARKLRVLPLRQTGLREQAPNKKVLKLRESLREFGADTTINGGCTQLLFSRKLVFAKVGFAFLDDSS
jgi:hypothetical protein